MTPRVAAANRLTCERLTPYGRGAVATIQLCGRIQVLDALFVPANHTSITEQILNRICYGHWREKTGEDLVCVRTAADTVEIHCHGGEAAVQRILEDLQNSGARVLLPNEASSQTLEAEFDAALQSASTRRTAHMLLRQRSQFPKAVQQLQQLPAIQRRNRIDAMLEWAEFGQHLTRPWQVVLCGQPNVGKSSLTNALVGYSRTVVYDQPGTTRDVVTVQTAFHGWPIELSDTAGLRETTEQLEAWGIEKARQRIAHADLLLVIADARRGWTEFEQALAKSVPRSLLVLNKIDLLEGASVHSGGIAVSATEHTGIEQIAEKISEQLVPVVPAADQPFPISSRQVELLQSLRCDSNESQTDGSS